MKIRIFDGNNTEKAILIDKDGNEVIIDVCPSVEVEIERIENEDK